jgi:GcrA cell cycle regulator
MTWTDERVETLKTMWTEGKSASQIARELGGVTRNAVIGKVHRLGLSNRNGPNDGDGEHVLEALPGAPEEAVPPAAAPPDPAAEAAGVPPGAASDASAPAAAEPKEPAPAEAREAARAKPVLPPVPAQPTLAPAPSEISPEALASLAEVERKARRLTLMQLTERTCKWPVGDPATDDFWFCGLPSAAGKPYCESHVAVAFQPMSSRPAAGSR